MLVSDEVTIEILKSIRDEIRGTNERLERLEARSEALERRQVESEIRLATEIVAVVGAVNHVSEVLKEDRQVRATVRNHEKRISALEKRVRR